MRPRLSLLGLGGSSSSSYGDIEDATCQITAKKTGRSRRPHLTEKGLMRCALACKSDSRDSQLSFPRVLLAFLMRSNFGLLRWALFSRRRRRSLRIPLKRSAISENKPKPKDQQGDCGCVVCSKQRRQEFGNQQNPKPQRFSSRGGRVLNDHRNLNKKFQFFNYLTN